jgi:hypothetical protein
MPAKVRNETMNEVLKTALRDAGYTEAQIAKEAAYLARVAWENSHIRFSRRWNYGIHHV